MIAGAVLVGVLTIMGSSLFSAFLYLACSFILAPVVIFSFCSKCPCRNSSCGHVIPGQLTRFLPARIEGGYCSTDLAGVGIPAVFILAFPQYWLWQQVQALLAFWALVLVAAADMRYRVCPGCDNRSCPFRVE